MSAEGMSTQTTSETTTTDQATVERCGQCGAPAAREQRYCLNCGFHRRNAPDPVARYLSETSVARARVAEATALAAGRRRTTRIGLRLAAALVAAALLIGIVIGNATGGRSAAPPARAHHATQKHSSQVKNATGSSYLQQEQNLPDTVTP
jgi:hypothetical protein